MTLFTDLVDPRELARGIEQKLITVREHADGSLIYNYSDAAMYTPGAWENPAVRQCRGLIVRDGVVVARPWSKFFNHGQAEAGDLDLSAPVEVTDKLDGSLGILYRDRDGEASVATRGSFVSDQAAHATAVLRERYSDLDWNDFHLTPLVEIIYPANRIVCDYGGMDDLVLLGAVEVETGRYLGPEAAREAIHWAGPVAQTFPFATLADALAAAPRPGMEGLCVRYLHRPHIVKIKQDDYVALHRIVTGLSERTVWQHMLDEKPLEDLLGPLPDELHDWTRDVWFRLLDKVDATCSDVEAVHEEIVATLDPRFERRDYAEQAKRHGSLTPYLFHALDGRDPRPAILKTLRPAGDTRALARSEAVA